MPHDLPVATSRLSRGIPREHTTWITREAFPASRSGPVSRSGRRNRVRIGLMLMFLMATFGLLRPAQAASSGTLFAGTATVNITPDQPILLAGSFRRRITKEVAIPCTATALALEIRHGEHSLDQAIFVSCDLVAIRGAPDFYGVVRQKLQGRVPDAVLQKLILNATHTHQGPLLEEGKYDLPDSGVLTPSQYVEFLTDRLAEVVEAAWKNRDPASVAWGLGHAVVGNNRRAVYADGSAVMFGKTDRSDFRGLEAGEDHGVELLYFWDANQQLLATAINLACPAQSAGGTAINADLFHQVRQMIQKKSGTQVAVLGWIGAAGDQYPRPIYRQAAEERMRRLRHVDLPTLLASRIVTTWEDVLHIVAADRHTEVLLDHRVETVSLPYRKLTAAAAEHAQQEIDKAPPELATFKRWWHGSVIDRYQRQQSGDLFYQMPLHAVRLGDVAIVTNDFELFTDYGVQMKARSPALQTFVIQLCGPATYLPTERAVRGQGYSAIPESNIIGPAGGQVLVEETVKLIQTLWQPVPKKP